MSKRFLSYVAFFAILAVGFYFVMTRLIPGYGDIKLPVQSTVRPFAFVNQDGRQVSEKDVYGKVYLAEFFFTTCKSICPIMNTNMKVVHEKFRNEPNFVILSHTCDPATDDVARIKEYADSLKVDTKKWWFLTGRKDSLYTAARMSYLLDDPQNNGGNIDEQFLHTQFIALVDKNGKVRKIYDGLKKDELAEIDKDVPNLLKEPTTAKRFANNVFGN
ncbi:MAG: SCO family protein [Chitinophagaceae bacterium]|nr:MAG: SCO family protein [Chitinophagaceae bacterium]